MEEFMQNIIAIINEYWLLGCLVAFVAQYFWEHRSAAKDYSDLRYEAGSLLCGLTGAFSLAVHYHVHSLIMIVFATIGFRTLSTFVIDFLIVTLYPSSEEEAEEGDKEEGDDHKNVT